MSQPSLGKVIAWGLLYGLFMTVTGWLGNNLLLAADWDPAYFPGRSRSKQRCSAWFSPYPQRG